MRCFEVIPSWRSFQWANRSLLTAEIASVFAQLKCNLLRMTH